MLNKYPAWKNLLILLVVLLGFLYSAPNLYQNDEALQITSGNLNLSDADFEVVVTALEAAQIDYFGGELSDANLLLRFDNVEDQLRAKTAVEDALGDAHGSFGGDPEEDHPQNQHGSQGP